jgi:CRISPR-associated protein Cas2
MSRTAVRRVLVAYDLPDDKRRAALARVLEGFGDRVQFSVFVVDAAPSRLVRMRHELAAVMAPTVDSILICDLGPVSRLTDATFSWLGRSRPITSVDSFIV